MYGACTGAMASTKSPHLPSKKLKLERLTAHQRPIDFPNEFLRASSKDILFCDACNHTLTWERKDTVHDHVGSKKHSVNKLLMGEKKRKSDKALLVQSTITQSFGSKASREEFVEDFLITVLSGGLSLEIADTFRPFLLKWCSQAGALPTVSGLRKTHLDHVFEKHMKGLANKIKGKGISIVFDESCDLMDRSVLNVIGGK